MENNISKIYSNIDLNKTRTLFEQDNKKEFKYNPYANLCGVGPYSSKDVTTSAQGFNAEMEKINKNKHSKIDYYKTMQGKSLKINRISAERSEVRQKDT